MDFEDPSQLTHLGGSLLAPPPDMEAVPVPAAEAAVALAIALRYYNDHATIDVDKADELKG